MSYRKITVDDKVYEYVVGKLDIKIKGVGIFDIEQLFGENKDTSPVQPRHIESLIRYRKLVDNPDRKRYCGQHGLVQRKRCDPYEAELFGRYVEKWYCDKCYGERQYDI